MDKEPASSYRTCRAVMSVASENPASNSERSRLPRTASRTRAVQLIQFAANGSLTAVIYSVAALSLIAASPTTLAADVAVSYAIAVASHYVGSRLLFHSGNIGRSHVFRYLSVVGVNFCATAGIAWLLHRLGAGNIISAYAPVVVTVVPTFVLMRSWVFRVRHP